MFNESLYRSRYTRMYAIERHGLKLILLLLHFYIVLRKVRRACRPLIYTACSPACNSDYCNLSAFTIDGRNLLKSTVNDHLPQLPRFRLIRCRWTAINSGINKLAVRGVSELVNDRGNRSHDKPSVYTTFLTTFTATGLRARLYNTVNCSQSRVSLLPSRIIIALW